MGTSLTSAASLFLSVLLLAGCASGRWDGRVRQWGTLREVLREGHVEGKAQIAEVACGPGATGIGALADLAGEVTVIEGETWVARPSTGTPPTVARTRNATDQAAFLVLATVPSWTETRIDAATHWDDLEALIASRADGGGLSGAETIPFVIEGDFDGLEAHVLNGACPFAADPAKRGEPVRFSRERTHGRLVGFFTTLPPGTLTHHGTRMHVHVVLDGSEGTSGHVDRADLQAGSMLRLPRR